MLSIAPGVPATCSEKDATRSGVLCSRPTPRAEQARPRRPAAFLNTSHHPPNRRLTALRVAGQPDSKMKMRLVAQHDGEELVQLYRTRFLGHESRLTGSRPDRPIRDARRAP